MRAILIVRAARGATTTRTSVSEEVFDDGLDRARILELQTKGFGRVVIPRRHIKHVDERLHFLRKTNVARENDLVRIAVSAELRVILRDQELNSIEHIGRARLTQTKHLRHKQAVVRQQHHIFFRPKHDTRLRLNEIGLQADMNHVCGFSDGKTIDLERLKDVIERLALWNFAITNERDLLAAQFGGLVGDILSSPLVDERDELGNARVFEGEFDHLVIKRSTTFTHTAQLRRRCDLRWIWLVAHDGARVGVCGVGLRLRRGSCSRDGSRLRLSSGHRRGRRSRVNDRWCCGHGRGYRRNILRRRARLGARCGPRQFVAHRGREWSCHRAEKREGCGGSNDLTDGNRAEEVWIRTQGQTPSLGCGR